MSAKVQSHKQNYKFLYEKIAPNFSFETIGEKDVNTIAKLQKRFLISWY